MIYRFARPARSPKAAVVLCIVWAALFAAFVWLQAAPWIIALLLVFTLPAAFDYARGRTAWLELDSSELRWRSGRQEGKVALPRIERIRLETRLDLTIRIRLVLEGGKRIPLPQDVAPPREVFEAECAARDIRTERHHFSLL